MGFSNIVYGSYGDQWMTSDDPIGGNPLGTPMVLPDGREFIHAQCGGTTPLAAGKLAQESVVAAASIIDLVVAADVAIGGTTITWTNTSDAQTVNQYAEGWILCNDATGEGYMYKIESNLVEATGTGVGSATLAPGETVQVALVSGTSEIGLRTNSHDAVVVAPSAAETGAVVGVSMCVVAINDYCWLQKRGDCPVLTSGTLVVGEMVTRSDTTGGAVEPYNQDGTGDFTVVGEVVSVAGDTEYSIIKLNI